MLSPRWEVLNEGSFASVCIRLPPNSGIHCESDAVVSMSGDVDVRGVLSGGFLAGLARTFLTRESFFTTRVENTSLEATGDALIAPSDPGGIALHRIFQGEEMFLTSGAYLAGDGGIRVESSMQAQLGNSLLSGTGFFLLRASGQGNLAISAYGSMHKFILSAGEKRMVDNGHLVAWTSSMKYKMKLASARAGIVGSMTSGEGLHCEFEGPGVIYVQSHKASLGGSEGRPRSGNSSGGQGTLGACIGLCTAVTILVLTLGITGAIISGALDFEGAPVNSPTRSPTRRGKYNTYGQQQQQQYHQQQQQQQQQQQYRQRQHVNNERVGGGGGGNEF